MPLPNNGWLPQPLNSGITQFPLPEVHEVDYYVCTPGPYDPLQPWQSPVVTGISIEQRLFSDAGWKKGSWGWVAGIAWEYAYGDALIETVWPPDEPTVDDESCPGNGDVADDACPPALAIASETRAALTYVEENRFVIGVTDDAPAKSTFVEEQCPGSRIGEGCE